MGGRVVLLRPVCDADAAGIDFIDWPRLRLRRAFFGRFMCLATPSVVLGESSIDIAARTAVALVRQLDIFTFRGYDGGFG